jgi:hypothetical protein
MLYNIIDLLFNQESPCGEPVHDYFTMNVM